MDLPVPHFSYEDLRAKADEIRDKYDPEKQVPVPIEHIVEFGFGVTIIPLPGLQDIHEVDAFMSHDCETMYVDKSVMEHRSPNRYRFSLAHELGHIVLHAKVFESISFSTAAEWKRVILEMDEASREWVEWQAYAFAGLILVPRIQLKQTLNEAVKLAKAAGFSFNNNVEVAKGYISTTLGRAFGVSARVIEKCLDKDGLWPPK